MVCVLIVLLFAYYMFAYSWLLFGGFVLCALDCSLGFTIAFVLRMVMVFGCA